MSVYNIPHSTIKDKKNQFGHDNMSKYNISKQNKFLTFQKDSEICM